MSFVFFGEEVLSALGITIGAFRVAGGILLLRMALEMLSARSSDGADETQVTTNRLSNAVVPLAIPLLAGPGAMSSVIIYTHEYPSLEHEMVISGVILIITGIVFASLLLSRPIVVLLGKTKMQVLHRVMGLIVASIAVEFILDGLTEHFPGLKSVPHQSLHHG